MSNIKAPGARGTPKVGGAGDVEKTAKVSNTTVVKTSQTKQTDGVDKAVARQSAGPTTQVWHQGIAPDTGKSQDYGHGRMVFSGSIHGVQTDVSYPKANSIPDIEFDPAAPVDQELAKISAQMQALYDPSSIPADAPPEVAKFRDFDIRKMIAENLEAAGFTSAFDTEVVINGRSVNMAKAAPESLTPDELTIGLKEILKTHVFTNVRSDVAAFYGINVTPGSTANVTGTAALKKLESVLIKAVELADKYGYGPPMPAKGTKEREQYLDAVTAFAVKNLFHGENLVAKHIAQGYDVQQRNPDLNETLSHDIVDRSTFAGLIALDEKAMEVDWTRAWALSEIKTRSPETYAQLVPSGAEPDEAAKQVSAEAVKNVILAKSAEGLDFTFNPNSGEPRYLLFMYSWGDSRSESDTDMDPHRAVNHHDGDITKATLNPQQKRQNGIEHHAGTEHEGVRHEAGLGYQREGQLPFEQTIRKISADGAFKTAFWRVNAFKDIVFQRILQEAGIVTPEQLQKIANPDRYLKLDAAYQALQGANSGADQALRQLHDAGKAIPAVAKAIGQIETLSLNTAAEVSANVRKATAKMQPADAALVWQALQAKAIQQAPRTVETAQQFMPIATEAAEAVRTLGVTPSVKLSSLTTQKAVEYRSALEVLPEAANDARTKEGDASLAAVYEVWNNLLRGGFAREA
jgi:hypothetical protein